MKVSGFQVWKVEFGLKVVGLEFGACLWFRVWVGASCFRSGVEASLF